MHERSTFLMWQVASQTILSAVFVISASPIAGAILDRENGRWTGVKVFSGVLCIAGTAFVFEARIYKVGWKFNVLF